MTKKQLTKKIKDVININLIKSDLNNRIVKKMYEELEKGNINSNALDYFEDIDTINYLSGIIASDFEINDVGKVIEDLINTYKKEELIYRRNIVIKKIEEKELSKEEVTNLEKELNEIILKLAKIK